jgi:hypothetical protein
MLGRLICDLVERVELKSISYCIHPQYRMKVTRIGEPPKRTTHQEFKVTFGRPAYGECKKPGMVTLVKRGVKRCSRSKR